MQKGQDVVRLRHYVCPHCGTPVGNREVGMKKLAEGKKNILCVNCEKRLPLRDELEELFSSPDTKQKVTKLQEQSASALETQSAERALVGEIISSVALAGQIARELPVSEKGIDMEIEFKTDSGEPTGKKIYLNLKSRLSENPEAIKILRTKQGEVRWLEASGQSEGERFDVMAVRRWRDRALEPNS